MTFKNQVFLKQCKAKCFTPPRWQSKPTGLVLALVAAFVLFSACRGGSNPEEIIEVIDNPNEPPALPTVAITVSGDYTGPTLDVNYLEKLTSTEIKTISGTITNSGTVALPSQPPKGALIVSITAGPNTSYVGRRTGASTIALNLKLDASGIPEFRPADSENKIPIGTYAEFQLINGTLGGSYKQEADLDFMGESGISGVPEWAPIGTDTTPFTGTFDGANKTIDRLYINKPNDYYVGLFGAAAGSSSFANVNIKTGSVTGKAYVGGLLGSSVGNSSVIVNNCSNGANITGTGQYFHPYYEVLWDACIGGLLGYINYETSKISNCHNSGNVTGLGPGVGGVVGISMADIIGCSNSGSILNNDKSGNSLISTNTGGVVGEGKDNIIACYNTGDVTGTGEYTGGVAGVAGKSFGVSNIMTACYNTGKVAGAGSTGGVVGASNAIVTACYNTGEVTGTSFVYSIGSAKNDDVTISYWKKDSCSANTTKGWKNGGENAGIFDAYFTPPSSPEWGTGDGSESGKYWKANVDYTKSLPKLWYEK
ncbi:MAG: hypothetical protein Ta2F_14410 [Termitinemataceae bacterium]|nr:MAG: hypothetical protein Ta2F_14410 [Termitinemataceae bacterium]